MRRFRRSFRRSRSSAATYRWVASSAVTTSSALQVTEGGSATSFDLTPGAPTDQWDGGSREPTLVRIRGWWYPLIHPSLALTGTTDNGISERRICSMMIYWRPQGGTLDPFVSGELSQETIVFSDMYVEHLRDYFNPAQAGTNGYPDQANLALAGNLARPIDIKVRRRVRSEEDRLVISAHMFNYQRVLTTVGNFSGGLLLWQLRFLYRTSR